MKTSQVLLFRPYLVYWNWLAVQRPLNFSPSDQSAHKNWINSERKPIRWLNKNKNQFPRLHRKSNLVSSFYCYMGSGSNILPIGSWNLIRRILSLPLLPDLTLYELGSTQNENRVPYRHIRLNLNPKPGRDLTRDWSESFF